MKRSFCRHCSKTIYAEGTEWLHYDTDKRACTEAEPLPCGCCGKCLDCIRLERIEV